MILFTDLTDSTNVHKIASTNVHKIASTNVLIIAYVKKYNQKKQQSYLKTQNL
jgi:hypothetical protein